MWGQLDSEVDPPPSRLTALAARAGVGDLWGGVPGPYRRCDFGSGSGTPRLPLSLGSGPPPPPLLLPAPPRKQRRRVPPRVGYDVIHTLSPGSRPRRRLPARPEGAAPGGHPQAEVTVATVCALRAEAPGLRPAPPGTCYTPCGPASAGLPPLQPEGGTRLAHQAAACRAWHRAPLKALQRARQSQPDRFPRPRRTLPGGPRS